MESSKAMLAVRSARGVSLRSYSAGTVSPIHTTGHTDGSPALQCRVMCFTQDGKYFAYCDGERVKVLSTDTATVKELYSFELPKTSALQFSPGSSCLCTFETLTTSVSTKKQPKMPILDIRYRCDKHVGIPNTECPCAKKSGTVKKGEFTETMVNVSGEIEEPSEPGGEKKEAKPNVKVWSLTDGKLMFEYSCKKQTDWEPQWTSDEEILVRTDGSEIRFYQKPDQSRFVHKLVIPKIAKYSLSCGPEPYHVACYVPEVKGTPASVRIFRYPDFKDIYQSVANKSFFNADRVTFKWNPKGTALVFMAIADVDKSGASYYGEQHLYLMLAKGDSFKVPLAKAGPVYDTQWNPNSAEFAVVYGLMPAKATLYNLKGEATFDFGTGPRNEVYYSPFGNILAICGFGNLKGKVEFWSMKEHRQICETVAEDTTYFGWAADGEHFLTATTAPRLRVNNSLKVWSYHAGKPEFVEKVEGYELWEVCWRPTITDPEKLRNPPPIHWDKAAAVEQTINSNESASGKQGAYIAPHLRGKPQAAAKFTIHEDELPQNLKQKNEEPSKNQKSKNKRQVLNVALGQSSVPQPVKPVAHAAPGSFEETTKKIRTVQKKLSDIERLKQKKSEGVKLEANQVEKLGKEQELLKELRELESLL